jgi:hypothetical protein
MTVENKMEWPQDGDRLVTVGPDFHNNACVSHYFPDNASARLDGFAKAAEVIVDHLAKSGRDLDILIYPLLFLHRHQFELALKSIIQDVILIERGKGFPPSTHDLKSLWKIVRTFIETRWEDDSMRKAATPFESLLNELAEMDPNAATFRYAFDQKGQAHMKDIPLINARHLELIMYRMSCFLSACKWISGRELQCHAESSHE